MGLGIRILPLLEKFGRISLHVIAICKAQCDVKLSQMEGNGRKFSAIS